MSAVEELTVCAWCGEPAARVYTTPVFGRTDVACRGCYRWLSWEDGVARVAESLPPWAWRVLALLALAGLAGAVALWTAAWLGRL